jgi:hypothetical protein
MPYLVDGNNLMHAMLDAGDDVGRLALCCKLDAFLPPDEPIHVVFDGPAPPAGLARQIRGSGVAVTYCPDTPADDIILREIAHSSAPKRLHVVSSDREIRKAARARRCQSHTSEAFCTRLSREHSPPPSAGPSEPEEKRHGLSDEQTEGWLEEFGLN